MAVVSNTLCEIVARTVVKTAMKKAVLREIADTVREHDREPRFWRSQQNTARRVGTSPSVISSNLKKLESEGLIFRDGNFSTPFGPTIKYGICIDAILALPSIDERDERKTLAKKLHCWVSIDEVITPFRKTS